MGKILKYCNSCDEGFGERFTFCPDCGGQLQAVEMNPLPAAAEIEASQPEAPPFLNKSGLNGSDKSFDTRPLDAEIEFAAADTEEIPVFESAAEKIADDAKAPKANELSVANKVNDGKDMAAKPSVESPKVFVKTTPLNADVPRKAAEPLPEPLMVKDDDGYHITVIEEKNVRQRNWLFLGATVFMLSVTIIAWGVSLFSKSLDIGAIGDERSIAFLLDEVPLTVEEDPLKKEKNKGGGGGGGGREEQQETSQGDLADQSRTPTRPPDVRTPRLENPSLQLPPPQTEGDRKFPKEFDRWGDPNSKFLGLSNGPGTGGGIGTGVGTGQGSGIGTGTGSGRGSGSGGGIGDGNGDGEGPGGSEAPPPVAKVTQPLRITYKQKAQYTDEGRSNNVQGSVTLRVTFLANGTIGPISVIKGLPYGLTEQAIAAARAMKFEPEMVNGVPRTTTRPVTFTFNIY